MRYAVIQNNQIINVCEWDGASPFTPGSGITTSLISNLPVGVGAGWTLISGTWTAPAVVAQTTGLTFQQFVSLFTVAEFNAIIAASITNPAVMIGFLKLVSYSGNIDLSSALVTGSLQGLVTLTLLTNARRNAILAGTIMNPAA